MSKKEKLTLIVGIAVIVICAVFVLFMLERFSIIRIFPHPAPKQEKVIQLDDLGSADTPIGKTAVVTIFAGDKISKWDFSIETDVELRSNNFESLKKASEWLNEQAKKYDKSFQLVIPTDENSDLYFEADFSDVLCDSAGDKDKTKQWQYIDNNFDSKKIKDKYECTNIIYLFFVNAYPIDVINDETTRINPYAIYIYDTQKTYDYELCFIPSVSNEKPITPAVIAHEILHLFGAPDLYVVDKNDMNYGIEMNFVLFCNKNHPEDIMRSTYDRETGKRLPDRITQEITDITAYYIGWLETAPDCIDEYRLVHSQHEYKNGQGINSQ